MATTINTTTLTFITSLFLCILLFGTIGSCGPTTGMYIFGDSLVDVGNNNYLPQSLAKANFPHNGVDYPTGEATGRFSNGKNAADFLEETLGLPSAPPYLSVVKKSERFSSAITSITGVSFASGGSGILNRTGELIKETIPLTEQVGYYSIVHEQLVQKLGPNEAQTHLFKSLFLVVIGSNDLFGYFNKESNVSKEYTPQEYVDLMVSTLKGLLKRLYELGARKVVAIGIGEIGCCPVIRKENPTSECNAEVNSWSMKYNGGLKALLQELKTESSGIYYSYFETYDVMNDIIQHPETYGITEVEEACCGRGNLKAEGFCDPTSAYCSNRTNHLFWDLYHPTEYTSSIFAHLIYNGSQPITTPMNVEQLVNV